MVKAFAVFDRKFTSYGYWYDDHISTVASRSSVHHYVPVPGLTVKSHIDILSIPINT